LSIEDAKEQANYEFGGAVGDWSEVPADVTDLRTFVHENSN
jgi:hypothetical protein